jgi:APA family basic amino acid/polyamine antiporter
MEIVKSSKKTLGFWMLFSLVVGNVIGAGIFLLPSTLAQYGSISILSWVITLLGSLCLAYVFSDLNRAIPITGGPFIYTRAAFGDFVGFIVAYTYWVAWCVGNASMALTIPGYLSVFFPAIKTSSFSIWINFSIEAIVVWLIIGINLCGIKAVGRTQVITTILKVIPLLVIGLVGLFKVNWEFIASNFTPSNSTPSHALLAAMTVTLWAFIGFESGTIPADDATSPRTIGRATLLGTLFVGFIYILCTFTLMGLFPASELKQSISPFADAANLLFGTGAAKIIAVCALISIIGALNGSVLVQTLDSVAAARFNLGPKAFTYLKRNNVAYVAFLTAGVAITLLLALSLNKSLIEQFNMIVVISTLAFLIPYFICCMGEFILLIKNLNQYTKHNWLKTLIITICASMYAFWTIIGAGKDNVFYGCLFFFSAFPMYVILFWCKRQKTTDFLVSNN